MCICFHLRVGVVQMKTGSGMTHAFCRSPGRTDIIRPDVRWIVKLYGCIQGRIQEQKDVSSELAIKRRVERSDPL